MRAEGASGVTIQGRELSFEPILELPRGEVARWNVEVRGTRPGDVVFAVRATSDSIQDPASSEEVTTVR